MARTTVRQQRLAAARSELPTLQAELAFEKISIKISDAGLHWQFFLGGKHLADYWPASAKGHIVGKLRTVPCGSPAQALKIAIAAKRGLFKRILEQLQSCAKNKI